MLSRLEILSYPSKYLKISEFDYVRICQYKVNPS